MNQDQLLEQNEVNLKVILSQKKMSNTGKSGPSVAQIKVEQIKSDNTDKQKSFQQVDSYQISADNSSQASRVDESNDSQVKIGTNWVLETNRTHNQTSNRVGIVHLTRVRKQNNSPQTNSTQTASTMNHSLPQQAPSQSNRSLSQVREPEDWGKIQSQKFIEENIHIWVFLFSALTVTICCAISQCMVRLSKESKLKLNAYLHKRKMEKNFLIQSHVRGEFKAMKEEERKAQEEMTLR